MGEPSTWENISSYTRDLSHAIFPPSASFPCYNGYKQLYGCIAYFFLLLFLFCQGREEAIVFSQIEEEQKQAELRRAQAALLEKQEKNNKKKENEEFLDSLVTNFAETFYNRLFAYCRFVYSVPLNWTCYSFWKKIKRAGYREGAGVGFLFHRSCPTEGFKQTTCSLLFFHGKLRSKEPNRQGLSKENETLIWI